MSQYPSAYPPPPQQPINFDYFAGGGSDPMAPGRRAGVLMYILGGVLTAIGACTTFQAFSIDANELMQQQQAFLPPGQPQPFSAETMVALVVGIYSAVTVVGLLLAALGTPVRRGGRGSTITAVVVTSIVLLFLALTLLSGLVMILMAPAVGAVFTCVMLVPVALFVLLMIWLIQALRAMPRLRYAHQQYQMQLWHHQQMQQQYGAGPYAPASSQPYSVSPPVQPGTPGYGYGYGQPAVSGGSPVAAPPIDDRKTGAPDGPPPQS